MRFNKVSHLYSILGNSSSQALSHPLFSHKKIEVDVKRDDLIHPIISGNKWRKLKYLLLILESKGVRKIASMGGRYSNLLHSLSYVCFLLGWEVEFFVLGYPQQEDTPTIKDAKRWGAKIHLVNKKQFREIRENSPQLPSDVFWVPEGGFDALATKGVVESFFETSQSYDYLVTATATGTTLAGYLLATRQLNLSTKVLGIPVLKNDDEIERHLFQLTGRHHSEMLVRGYEYGGFGKVSEELNCRVEKYSNEFNLPLEPVYSGKAFSALIDLAEKDFFPNGSRILFVHCGGMQGSR